MRTVLFGLDGATYTVLDHLIAEGVMPRLAELYRTGTRAILRSTPTPLTPQAWTTLATGRSPGHHGVTDFVRPEPGGEVVHFRVNDSRDNHCETLWRYVSRHGQRVTVLNYFGTAPAEPVAGHVIPGWISARHLRRLSHPADLCARLQAAVPGFEVKALGLDPDTEEQALRRMPEDQWCPWIRHHIERERGWFSVMDHLMATEPSDLTAVVFDGVDKIQHLAYRFLDPALAPKEPTPWEAEVMALCRAYFRQIDDFLSRVLERVGRWGRVFIASDHGFTATNEIVYINKWLCDQGLLRWRTRLAEDEQQAIFSQQPREMVDAIDLPNTRAYALLPSSNGIYLNVSAGEYHGFREDVIRRLGDLRGPDGGPIITAARTREECFPGPFMQRAPDLTLTLRDHGFVSVLNARAAVIPRSQPAGTHHPHGVLLGTGLGIRAGADAGQLDILDVAPLLLHSLGLEIPGELEGAFPTAFYEPGYLDSDRPRIGGAAATLSVSTPTTEDEAFMDEAEQAVILERLKNLGYIE